MSGVTFLPIAVRAFYGTLRMFWVEAFHIVFIASWFAGLPYLPCIFVNLAVGTEHTTITHLLVMACKLFRFTTILAIVAVLLGLWLFLSCRIGLYPPNDQMHAELALVLATVGYHRGCGVLLHKFEASVNERSHKFCHWFNELPMLLLLTITILVVVKPF